MRIRIMKKIIVVLIIIAMLQTQIVSLTNVAWAINMEMTGEIEQGGMGTDGGGELVQEETVAEETLPDESTGETEEVPGETEEVPEENDTSSEETPDDMPEVNSGDEPQDNTQELPADDSNVVEETPEEGSDDLSGNEVEGEIPEDVPEGNPEPEEEVENPPEEAPVVEPKVELLVTSENSSIYKGYLYANATSDLRYETKYNTIEEVKIEGTQNGITSVIVREAEDKIKMITENKMALLNNIYYKRARVSVDEFNAILGESGIINIYDADEDFVGYIDAQSPIENGYYVYDFIYYTNSVKYELSSPIADGTIKIVNDKAIKEDAIYSREQIVTFSAINVMSSVEMIVGENVLTATGEGDITLQETESRIEIELDKTELSTEDENELTMTLTLKTDAERYELFKNPVIEVEMPSNVNEMTIEGVNLLYRNGLSLKNWEVVENDNGVKVLRVELDGAQSVYTPGVVQQGTTLVLYLKVNVNKLTANTNEALKLTYTNEDSQRQAYVLEGKSAEEVVLTFVAKHGVLKGATATNLNTSMVGNSYEDEVAKVEVKSMVEAQTVSIKGTIVNNFDKEVTDVVIVGRIPFVGNKNGNGDELLSNFDTILKSEILTSGNMTEIYYSENGEAGKDDETWTQDVTDISKYKSYKIVVQEGTLKKGEKVDFTYDVEVPENLGYNLKSYATYKVEYKLDNQELSGNCTVAIVTEEKELEADDLEDKEEVEKIKIGTQVSQGGRVLTAEDSVYERQILRYTVVVTNTSNEVLTNVKLTGRAENANMYTWEYFEKENYYGTDIFVSRKYSEDIDGTRAQDEMIIETLNPGESKIFEYQVITKDLTELINDVPEVESEDVSEEMVEDVVDESVEEAINEPTVHGIITVSADNLEELQLETIRNKVIDSEIELKISYSGTESLKGTETVTSGELPFNVYVKNISDSTLEDVKVNVLVPNEITININSALAVHNPKNYEFTSQNTENGIMLTFIITKLNSQESDAIYFSAHTNSINITEESCEARILAFVEINDKSIYSNDYIRKIYQGETEVEYTWKSDYLNETVNDGDLINYELILKNIGTINAGNLNINIDVPTGLKIKNVTKIIDNTEKNISIKTKETGLNYITDDFELEEEKEYKLKISGMVYSNAFKLNQETIDMKVSVYGGKIDAFETNVISYKINNENVTVDITEENTEDVDADNNEDKNDGNINSDSQNNNDINDNENIDDKLPNIEDKIDNPIQEEVEIKTYKISGKVWLDKNKDGINRNESGMKSIVVILYRATEKGNLVSKVQETVTNSNGEYTFSSVASGSYVVVFSYDTSMYNSTKYRVSTATGSENSDAITKAMTGGDIVGVTDVITLNGSGAIDVDLGLVNKNEFDLTLEKYVDYTKIINDEGTKVNKYEENKNVKLEIHSKYYKGTTVEIAYKIRVTNTGEVSGYINKIVDYVPDGMKFDNSKNPDWYYGDDGNLYYKGMVGTELAPGSSKEIILILTKVLEDGAAVKLTNGAEIAESTNSMGLEDIDSIPNNKNGLEDDYSQVSLTITVSTGSQVQNILIVIVITLSVIAIIVYIAKLKFTKKVYR